MRFKRFACAFLMTVLAVAAEGEWFTDGSLNGRGWKAIPIESRNSYLFGFCDAIHVEAKEKYHYYTTGKNTYTELRELLDQFYANAANTLIPVHAALVFVNLKVIGE